MRQSRRDCTCRTRQFVPVEAAAALLQRKRRAARDGNRLHQGCVRPGHAPVTGWTWAAGLLTVYAVVMVFYLPPRVALARRALVRWAIAVAPCLYFWVAVMLRSPAASLWVGFGTSTRLLGWAALASSEEAHH